MTLMALLEITADVLKKNALDLKLVVKKVKVFDDGSKENSVTVLWNVGVTLPIKLDVNIGVEAKDVTLAATVNV